MPMAGITERSGTMNRALDFMDNAILDSIAMTSHFNDIQLARDFGVPRTQILDRLRCLITCGFVKRQDPQVMSAPCVQGVQMICLESEDILKNESNKNEQDHICEIKSFYFAI